MSINKFIWKRYIMSGGVLYIFSFDIKQAQIIKVFTMQGIVCSVQETLDNNVLCSVYNRYLNDHIIKYKNDRNA